ncbi:uncharacterized protein LOC100250100 isoform X2 [Vitis vinifera]|uniref:Uncharacterized protein n=1 Tax=Vitis vinifera TaxID=29760 RepID=D7TNL6_VITVI|eukprot:XP_002268639.1 PREDICTED: uncharacterized protein LOC100250100 isoform X2 [Vitis vinifera]
MGNCQAIDAAALVIQHPCGRIERLYWTVSAGEVMRMNPGHYVSLIIPLPIPQDHDTPDNKTVRFTRVKLLRPTDTLVLGHAYRLITSQEVMKVLRAKKYAKMKKNQVESAEKLQGMAERQSSSCEEDGGRSEMEKSNQVVKHERHRPRTASTTSAAAARSKSWRPSLQSISEAGS